MVTQQRPQIIPSPDQVQQTRQRIDAYIQSIANHPDRREGAFPYYLFHEPGTPIQGTVLLFHGFSARPHQMARLADYLFRNGYNVYQATLAGHAFKVPDSYWPQVDLKPEIIDPLREKVQSDPVLQQFFTNLTDDQASGLTSLSPFQMIGLVARLRRLEPQMADIVLAIERAQDPDFDRYYVSSHMDYLHDAQARLEELAALPGPIYTVGLSVGGAVALALAAANPDRVKKVVAYAPLLEVYGEARERYVNLAGPLDIREFGWDDLRFPLGCFTAANRFGSFVRQRQNEDALQSTPTLFVLTENEDAADLKTNQKFAESLKREGLFQTFEGHYLYTYPNEALVPHPMVDPQEVSQGMSNAYWKTMYQETFRFLSKTEFNPAQMDQLTEDPSLPAVPSI